MNMNEDMYRERPARPKNYKLINYVAASAVAEGIKLGEVMTLSHEDIYNIFPHKKEIPQKVGTRLHHNALSTYLVRYIQRHYSVRVFTRKVEGGVLISANRDDTSMAYYAEIKRGILALSVGETFFVTYEGRDSGEVDRAIRSARICTYNTVGVSLKTQQLVGGWSICRRS